MLRSLLMKTITFLAIAQLLPGFHVHGFWTAIWMAVVYGVVSTVLAVLAGVTLIAGAVALVATVPPLALLAFLTAPLILFVTDFFMVLVGLKLTAGFVSGFGMSGSWTAFEAALILACVSALFSPSTRAGIDSGAD
ncbi:MAG: phage holin family protein [Candidatus Wallbacteria bacterium]|nr:phage holin family protein [Candidatus Wallbacteria bacterium]